MNPWELYESRKAQLEAQGLSGEAYAGALVKILEELGI